MLTSDSRQKFVLQHDVDILHSKLRVVTQILEDIQFGLLGTREPQETEKDACPSIENTVRESLNEADEIMRRARYLRNSIISEYGECDDDEKPLKKVAWKRGE